MTAASTSNRFAYACLLLLVAATVLRSLQLGYQEVWMDEAFSALITRLEPHRFLEAMWVETNPPLYFLLLKAFCALFGQSPAAIRALSVAISVATIAVVLVYGARLFGRRFALGAGAFLALSPYSLYYAQEARGYSLLILLIVLALLAAYDAVARGSKRAVWIFGLSVLAAGYTHYFAAVALVPLAGFMLWRYFLHRDARHKGGQHGGERRRAGQLLLVLVGDAVLCGLWLIPRLAGRSVDPLLWIAEQWAHLDKLWVLPKSLLVLLLGSSRGMTPLFMKQETLLEQPLMLAAIVSAAAAGLLVLALMRRPATASTDSPRWVGLSLIAAVLVPLALLFAVSFARPLYVTGRYDVVAFPWLVVLAGWVAHRCVGQVSFIALAALLFGGMLYKDAQHLSASRAYHDFDAALTAELVQESVHDGDVLVFTGMRGTSVLYYLSQNGFGWDGEHCRHETRQLVLACRILPYTDAGVPFAMGTAVTTPVNATSAVADFNRILRDELKAGSSVWILYSRQREPANVAVDREIAHSLRRNRYVFVRDASELDRYRIRKLRRI